ncbi:MAG: substrate-binding domain-containing protein [Verrucomicrobia bacterium]|nr:substrate-binding domain-containing protein [Verrucomicrobiota bacterium]
MATLRRYSAAEQTANHLRSELKRGVWMGVMPGISRLAKELVADRKTVEAALKQLEHEGLLVGQGPGRQRRIVLNAKKSARAMRVAILLYEPEDRGARYMIELHHALMEAGHTTIFHNQFLAELNHDLTRIERVVKQTEADAWVVMCGSQQVLEWFSKQQVPAFALFGRREGLTIAASAPDKAPAMVAAASHLVAMGHRRIVLLARKERRLPQPGRVERIFLDELKAHGIATSDYNLPDWEETKEGFQKLLDSLFRVTPPTAMIIDETHFFVAAQQFLAARGIRVPQQVSLICTDTDPAFSWCMQPISHIQWDAVPLVHQIAQWAESVSRGHRDVKQTFVPAEFIAGGTTGAAAEGKK